MTDDDLPDSAPAASLGAWQLVGLGGFFVGCIVAGLVLGWLADQHLDTSPVFVLVGIAIAIIGAAVGAWARIKPFLDQ